MSVRSLTRRLHEERSEARRRSADPIAQGLDKDVTPDVFQPRPSAMFKGSRLEPVEETQPVEDGPKPSGLKPRAETSSADVPCGIADRFRLRSQRASDLSRSIDAYTSQLTVATPESDENTEDPDSDTAPITIELQSH